MKAATTVAIAVDGQDGIRLKLVDGTIVDAWPGETVVVGLDEHGNFMAPAWWSPYDLFDASAKKSDGHLMRSLLVASGGSLLAYYALRTIASRLEAP